MERLEIGLLGGFELRRDGRVLDPLTLRAARSLFAFLVLNRDRAHTRDLLAGTFWPDFDEPRARRRLSQALWQTQRALGEDDGQRYIIGTADTVRFNPEAEFWLDVDEFTAAIEEADSPDRDAETDALERAVDLYRGDLLAGFYDDWLFADQDRFRTSFLSALERLADLAVARSDYESGLLHARRLAQENEFDEEAHRRVMRIAVLLGRHNEALRQFEECRRILAEELGAEPSAETVELYEATLADRDAGGRGVPSEEFPLFGEADTAPFVGREGERAAFAERLDDVLEGTGRIVLLEGESGVGKSRLLREVAADAQWRGMDVVWGRSTPTGGRPFGPIGDALRSGLSDLRIRQLAGRLDDTRIASLAPLIPRLAPDAPSEVEMGMADERARTHEAIGAAFQGLAAINPTLVVLEDVHWADEDTISALEQLAQRVGKDPICIAVTYRHGEARERSEVWNLLRTLDRLEYGDRVSLAALTPAQTEDLIRRSLGRSEVSGGFSERLHRDTGGVPLFILETLRAMYELDSLAEAEDPAEAPTPSRDHLPLAPSVLALIRQRLDALDTEPRRLLELISCHDGDLHLREAVEATELVNDTALAAVDELRRRRLIEASGELIVGDHEVMRRVIYEELPAARRIDLHRRLGEAIEQSRPGEAEFLAHHFTQARIPERAAAFHEQAAGLASDVHAFDRSSHYWTQALAQLNEIGAPSDRRYRAARELEQVLDVLARREDQEYALAQMARWASTDSQRAEVAWRRAWWLAHQDRFQEARVEAERAVTSASELADAGLKLEAFTTAGMIHCYSGSALEGVELLERATGVDGPSARQLADARNALGQNLIDLQRFDEAKSHLLAALDLYREADNARGQAEVLGTLATMRMETGDPDSAERDFNAAIQMSQAIGYRHGEAVYEMNLGILYVITNRIASAIQSFMRAETRYAAMGNRRGRALVLSNSAWLLHGLVGDDDEATSQITEARAIYDEIGDERGLAHCEALLGSMHGRKHEIDKAHELFESALERTRRLDDSWLTAQGLREYAATDLENGNIASGTKHILEAESLCADFGFNDLLVGVRALAARLLLRAGRVEEAETRARRAMRELRTGVEFAHLVPFAACEVDDVLGRTESADAHIANSKSQLDAMLSELDPDQRERSWAAIPNHVSIAARWRSATPERLEISAATLPEHRAEVGSSVCVSVTVRDPADDAIPDRVARRRRQIQRIIEEAASQFGVLTTKQLASLLGAGDATIRRDLAALRAEGAELATKGSRSNHQ